MEIIYSIEEIENRPSRSSHLYSINEVLFNSYIANRIIFLLANFTKVTPNQVTLLGFCSVIIAAFMFLTNHLIFGAIFFNLRWILDLVDGGLAELKGKTSKFGAFLDPYTGIIGFSLCIFSMSFTQFNLTENTTWFWVAILILFFDMLHSWESPMVFTILGKTARKKQEEGALSEKLKKSRIYRFLMRNRLREPLCRSDLRMFLFVVSPILSIFTGFLLEMWIFVLIIMFLKAIFWFYYYSMICLN